MKKTKGRQNYLLHKIKEKKIHYGIVIGVNNLEDDAVLYIDTGELNYDWAIEALEGYIDIIKAEREEQRQNTTVALPFAITREAFEDNLFQDPVRLADMPNAPMTIGPGEPLTPRGFGEAFVRPEGGEILEGDRRDGLRQADPPIGTIDFTRNLVFAGHGQWIDRHTGEAADVTDNVDVEWQT